MARWPLSGTWAESTIGGQKELSIVFLPAVQSSIGSDSHVVCTRQLTLLKPGTRANTTQLTYVFQLDFGSHTAALEGIFPNMHVEAIRRHRASVTSIRKFFQRHAQAWLNDVEDDCSWRDAMVEEMRQGGHTYSEAETALIANGMAQHLLGQAIGIDVSSIEKVHPRIKGLAHKGAGLVLILATNHSPKSIPAKGHGAKAKF
jgi:hypothetical protein